MKRIIYVISIVILFFLGILIVNARSISSLAGSDNRKESETVEDLLPSNTPSKIDSAEKTVENDEINDLSTSEQILEEYSFENNDSGYQEHYTQADEDENFACEDDSPGFVINNKMQSSIFDYSVIREDYSTSTDKRRLICYFDVVTFYGEKSFVEPINQIILEKKEEYEKSLVKGAYRYAEGPDTTQNNVDYYYSPLSLESVYYDDIYLSVVWTYFWHIGGVGNTGWESITFDLSKRSQISIFDLFGENTKEIVCDALIEEFGGDKGNQFSTDYINWDDLQFSVDDQSVYIYIDPYEILQGGAGLCLQMRRPDIN